MICPGGTPGIDYGGGERCFTFAPPGTSALRGPLGGPSLSQSLLVLLAIGIGGAIIFGMAGAKSPERSSYDREIDRLLARRRRRHRA